MERQDADGESLQCPIAFSLALDLVSIARRLFFADLGCCFYILAALSMVLIILTFPLSLFCCIKVSRERRSHWELMVGAWLGSL